MFTKFKVLNGDWNGVRSLHCTEVLTKHGVGELQNYKENTNFLFMSQLYRVNIQCL